jgi:hypothetical protein
VPSGLTAVVVTTGGDLRHRLPRQETCDGAAQSSTVRRWPAWRVMILLRVGVITCRTVGDQREGRTGRCANCCELHLGQDLKASVSSPISSMARTWALS